MVFKNKSDKDVTVAHDGKLYVVPAKEELDIDAGNKGLIEAAQVAFGQAEEAEQKEEKKTSESGKE